MEVISYQPALLDELVELIIFEHADVLSLIQISKTCKKYRSEYIVQFYRTIVVVLHDIGKDPFPVVTPDVCSTILCHQHVQFQPWGGIDQAHVYPKITNPFTFHLIQKLLKNAKDLDLDLGFEV